MLFQRQCREGASVFLKTVGRYGLFLLLAEAEGRIAIAYSAEDQLQWALKPGDHLQLSLLDRGCRFEATLELAELGDFEGSPCWFFNQPRTLYCPDQDRFLDLILDKPPTCVFSTASHDLGQGLITSMGMEGIELQVQRTGPGGLDSIDLDAPTTVEFAMKGAAPMRLPGTVAYLREAGFGVRFNEDKAGRELKPYRAFVLDALFSRLQRDRENFVPSGTRTVRNLGVIGERPGLKAKLWVDRDPLLFLICDGEDLPRRLAEALGRKFGLVTLDYLQGPVQPLLEAIPELGAHLGDGWGRIRLVLVHQRLRLVSGMDLIQRLFTEEACPLPILAVGNDQDQDLKRDRALSLGALDYQPVEPLRLLALKVALETILAALPS